MLGLPDLPAPKAAGNAIDANTGATVNTAADGTATVTNVAKSAKAVIPDAVTGENGTSYTVTAIAPKAINNKVKTLTVGKNIRLIRAKAFSRAKRLRTIQFTGTNAVKVNKKAFKGINTKKITIKVKKQMSKKNYRAFAKSLKKAGFKGKIKKIK